MTINGWGDKRGRGSKGSFITVLAVAAILPMILIALFGMIKMQLNPAAANEITSQTVEQIVNYFGNNIVYFLLSDVAGVIAGAILQAFRGRNN